MMNTATAIPTPAPVHHLAHAAMAHSSVSCAWCGEPVRRKPVSGARLSHTICRPCAQQFLAQAEQERNSRWI